MNRKQLLLILSSVVLAFSAPAAGAQTPTSGGYGPIPIPLPPVSTHRPTPHASRTVGSPHSLPFTGLDVRLLVLSGMGLLGAGYGLRRRTRPSSE